VTSRPELTAYRHTDTHTSDERKNSLSRRIGAFARSVKKPMSHNRLLIKEKID